MNCELGRVVAIEAEKAWVETIQNSTCTTCSAKSGCGQRLLNSVFKGKRHLVEVSLKDFPETVYLYDTVELTVDENVLLRGAFWVYLVPLICIIAGALFGQQWVAVDTSLFPTQKASELPVIFGALSGLAIGFGILALHHKIQRFNPRYQPRLHKVVGQNSLQSEAVVFKPS